MAKEEAILKLNEARKILGDLAFPSAQQNERAALALLALCDMTPEKI